MTQKEILKELKRFSTRERLEIIETTLHLIRQQLRLEKPAKRSPQSRSLSAAAKALLPDYLGGGELTAFTGLDSAPISEEGPA